MKFTTKQILGNVLFIAVMLLIVGRLLSVIAGTTFPISVVSSHSMEPALHKGDVVPWMPCSIDAVKEGDVVVYASTQSWEKEKLVVHRVASIQESDGEPTLITKGDANNFTDQAGPHVPEPPITGGMLKGKALMLGGQPLKIPFAGYPWLLLNAGVKALTRPLSWGQPQPRHHYGIFAPAIVAISLVVAGAVLWAPGNGRRARERLHDSILGPERLSWKRIFVSILLFYLAFLMITASFSYDCLSTSLGVDMAPPKSEIAFGTLHATESSFPQSVSVVNPSMLPVHGMVFPSGSIARFLDTSNVATFSLDSGGRFSGNITATVPAGTTPGAYSGHLYIYSTPCWSLVPLSTIGMLRDWHPQGAIVVLTLLSAIALTLITFLLLAALSFVVERWHLVRGYLAWRLLPVEASMSSLWQRLYTLLLLARRGQHVMRRFFSWMEGTTADSSAFLRPCAVSLVCLLAGALLLYARYGIISALLAASAAGGVIAYAAGCRWRSQFIRAALLTTAWFSGLYIASSLVHVFRTTHSLLVPLASAASMVGIVLFIFTVLAVPVGLFFWLPGYLIHSMREKWNPTVLLQECDI